MIHISSSESDIGIMKYIDEQCPELIDKLDFQGLSPLMLCIFENKFRSA